MHCRNACHHIAGIKIFVAAREVRYHSAGLLDDDAACRYVPGAKAEFEETLAPPRTDVRQVERRRTRPS